MDWGLIVNHSVMYGAILSGALGALIIASLRINPEMWLHDYPPDVQAAWGPISDKARRQRNIFVVPFFAALTSILILATARLNSLLGGAAPFGAVFASTAIIAMSFNLVDAVIIDLLVPRLWPRLMVLPGTEGMAGYSDMRFWTENLFKGFGFVIAAGLVTAGISTLAGWIGSLL